MVNHQDADSVYTFYNERPEDADAAYNSTSEKAVVKRDDADSAYTIYTDKREDADTAYTIWTTVETHDDDDLRPSFPDVQ